MESSKTKRLKAEISAHDLEISKFKEEFFKELNEIKNFNKKSKKILEVLPLHPENVKNVARIITAMPPTQVSVKRLFSALKIIKSDLRASMKEDLIEAVLFLGTNMV